MRWSNTLAGRFEIGEPAAAGGMGTVYRATDRQTGKAVAAKVIAVGDVEDVERFEREAAVLATLDHPGIVRYIAHGVTEQDEHYLVMEWIDGESLAARMADPGLTMQESVRVALQVARALAEAHRHGVIHRDIKPENLMLEGGSLDRVRVLDFGLARLIRDDQRLTRTGTAMGTPGYMSPESARGSRELDGRSDIFALGCVLYECLAGRGPFLGENVMTVQLKVLMSDPVPLAKLVTGIPDPLVALVTRMLAKAPADRHASMAELAHALALLPPLPHRERQRAGHVDTSTAKVGARANVDCMVLAAPRRPRADLAARIVHAAEAWHDSLEVLRDGAVAIRHASASAGARCALELARQLPDAVIVLSAPATSDPLEAVIDRATQVMSVAALRAVLARNGTPGAVHLDPVTAAQLRGDYEIVEADGGLLLRGERPDA